MEGCHYPPPPSVRELNIDMCYTVICYNCRTEIHTEIVQIIADVSAMVNLPHHVSMNHYIVYILLHVVTSLGAISRSYTTV